MAGFDDQFALLPISARMVPVTWGSTVDSRRTCAYPSAACAAG